MPCGEMQGFENPLRRMDEVVLLEKVSRAFRGFLGRRQLWAVRDLTLHVERGEVFGLLGPNGSGKTTTLQMVLGLLSPTQGRITVFGGSPREASARRRIGYLPEEFTGPDYLSGEETLLHYGAFFGLSRSEVRRRAEELLHSLDLWEDRRRRVREYSKGMRRRIGFAQSLLHDPELIVLDEPTAGLDPLAIRKVKEILLGLKSRGRAVVVSSHILPEMEEVCDRVAILDKGRTLVSGRLIDLLTLPQRHLIAVRGTLPPLADLESLLSSRGLSLDSVRAERTTLEDLFLRIVEATNSAYPPRSPGEESAR